MNSKVATSCYDFKGSILTIKIIIKPRSKYIVTYM